MDDIIGYFIVLRKSYDKIIKIIDFLICTFLFKCDVFNLGYPYLIWELSRVVRTEYRTITYEQKYHNKNYKRCHLIRYRFIISSPQIRFKN